MELAASQREQLVALTARLHEGVTTPLDPQKPEDRCIIETFLDLSNKRSDRYPALHAGLARAKGPVDASADSMTIVDAGRTRGGHATASGWHAARGGAFISGAATLALDHASGEPLAFGAGTQVGGTRATASTNTAEAAPAGGRVTALSFFHAQRTPEEAPRFGVAMESRAALGGGAGPTIEVTHPHGTEDPIVIAVGRIAKYTHCAATDYCYIEPAADLTTPLLLVPFAGKVTGIPSPYKSRLSTGAIPGLSVDTALYLHGSSQAKIAPADAVSKLAASVHGDPNDDTAISWSFPFDQTAGQANSPSLRYGPASQDHGKSVAFLFMFSVPVQDPARPRFASRCAATAGATTRPRPASLSPT